VDAKKLTDKVPDWHEGLTDKERIFIEEYLLDFNGTQAAIRAGFRKPSAANRACAILNSTKGARAVERLLSARGAVRVRLLDEAAKAAFADTTDYAKIINGKLVVTDTDKLAVGKSLAIASISETITEFGSTITVKPYDKFTALAYMAKLLSLTVDRTEVSGPNGGPIEVVDGDDLQARLEARLALIAKRKAENAGGNEGGAPNAG
jgi:phage terminase small subunit